MNRCEECGINPANIHLTQIVNNQTTVVRLCEGCARKKGISISIGVPQATEAKGAQEEAGSADNDVVCPRCDLSLGELKERGWLGCPRCYQAFADEIDDLLLRVHGSRVHKGKHYRGAAEGVLDGGDVHRLRKEMELAIRSEKFELAAAIRDKINGMPAVESSGGREVNR